MVKAVVFLFFMIRIFSKSLLAIKPVLNVNIDTKFYSMDR